MNMKTHSTLSACIIAKNEENNIETCLKSLKGVVDEIILVDTGSTDKTVEIAKKYGAKIYYDEWDNNFAKARNYSISKATKDYILYIDCDEYLSSPEWKNIHKLLDKRYEGFCLLLSNIIDGQETLSAQSFRIFKNRPKYEFRGRIHEQVINSILDIYKPDDIGFINVKISHKGYDSTKANIEAKKERNFKIYESYKDEEKDGFYYYNLAGEYSRAGMANEALESYIKSSETDAFDNGFRQYLAIYLTKSYFEFKRFKSAIEYSSKYLQDASDFADLLFLRGTCYYYIGKFTEALSDIEAYEQHKGNLNYPNFKLNESNDLTGIKNEIKNNIIGFDKSFFRVIIDGRKNLDISNFIKLNEFTDEIIILTPQNISQIDYNTIEEMGAIPCRNYEDVIRNCTNCKYCIYFKSKEYIDRNWLVKIIDEINKERFDYIQSMALTEDEDVYTSVRMVKVELLREKGLDIFELEELDGYSKGKLEVMIMRC